MSRGKEEGMRQTTFKVSSRRSSHKLSMVRIEKEKMSRPRYWK